MSNQYKEVFFNFVKQHSALSYLEYSDSPVPNQEIIRLIVSDHYNDTNKDKLDFTPEYIGNVSKSNYQKTVCISNEFFVLDPSWDEIVYDFTNQSYIPDTVAYFNETYFKTPMDRQQQADFLLEMMLKPLIAQNINRKTVYVVTSDFQGWQCDIWANEIRVETTIADAIRNR